LQYIRRLLFSDLDKTTVQHILLQLLKLPWAECEQYIVKCFLKVHKGKYSQVHLIALLTAGLSRYHDDFAVVVVDEVSYFSWNGKLFQFKEQWKIMSFHFTWKCLWHANLQHELGLNPALLYCYHISLIWMLSLVLDLLFWFCLTRIKTNCTLPSSVFFFCDWTFEIVSYSRA